MPRVHNIDIIQRTKHTRCNTNNTSGGGIISSTSQPKNNITVASTMMHGTNTINGGVHGTNNNNNREVDNMEFNATNNNIMNTTQHYQPSTSTSTHQNQSPNKSPPPNKSLPATNTTQQYTDGLEADDDSDATTCDGSVDLLADDDNTNSQHTENANLKNKRGVSRSIGSGFNGDYLIITTHCNSTSSIGKFSRTNTDLCRFCLC